jgi:hypothetical protein
MRLAILILASAALGCGRTAAAAKPAWVAQDPRFDAFFPKLGPACASVERWTPSGHSYAVEITSLSRREVDARFAREVGLLGYVAKRLPRADRDLLAFDDEPRGLAGYADHRRAALVFSEPHPLPTAEDRARRVGSELADFLRSVVPAGALEVLEIEVRPGALVVEGEIWATKLDAAAVAAWARAHDLAPTSVSTWTRPKTPTRSAITLGPIKFARFEFLEERGEPDTTRAECQLHPSRRPTTEDP